MARFDTGLVSVRSNAVVADLDALLRSFSRLEAVHRVQLLDTPPEETFDALTRLAVALLKTPSSFISIVDSGRDFYKSQVGFPEPLATQRQLSGRTFCHYTLGRQEPLVINDTHVSPEWKAVPTVSTLGVRAYVGVPLQVDGETVGSFCVIDMQPRIWSAVEVEILVQLAKSAGREISLRTALHAARGDTVRLQELVRAKEEIAAVVAHDLRTPLQVLSLSASLLQQSATPAQQALAQRMLAAIEAMKRLTEHLLSASAIVPSSNARRQPIAVATLLGDAVNTMGMIAARAQVELTLNRIAEVEVVVDYAQMLRVFCNLVGNSIKYCPAGSVVSLGCERHGNEARLSVTDNGPGMSAEEQLHAFERGWQGVEGRARSDGAGLGLPIVRALVEENGGHVQLASEPGQGTSVTVGLPCRS